VPAEAVPRGEPGDGVARETRALGGTKLGSGAAGRSLREMGTLDTGRLRLGRAVFALAAVLALLPACKSSRNAENAPPPPAVFPGEWRAVDLTRPVDGATPHLPSLDAFRYERLPIRSGPGGRREAAYSLIESAGTHLSAPAAYIAGGATVDTVDAAVVRPLVVLRVPDGAMGALPQAAIRAFEGENGQIPRGALVVLQTGRSGGSARDLETALRTSPGFAAETVRFLAAERGVFGIGTDAMAIDDGEAVDSAAAARAAAEAGLVTVSALTGLTGLPATGAYVLLGVIPLSGAGAAPVRAVALVPDAPAPATAPTR